MRLPSLRLSPELELRLSVAVLALLFLGSGIYWAWLAPSGTWNTRVFEVPIWASNDPGGWYITGGHDTLLHPGQLCFGGHPGTPLDLLLAAEQGLLYRYGQLAGADAGLTRYLARHVRDVWFLGKAAMVVANLITLFLLYHYARALVRRDLAFLAVALYATSFPATYYQARLAPEPLTNLFFLATLVALLRSVRPGAGEGVRLAWAALAGFAAVSAVLCKLMLMAAWPIYAGALILAAPNADLRLRQRLRLLGAYLVALLASTAAYAPFTDWRAFADTWGPGQQAPAGALIGARLAGFVRDLLAAVSNMPVLNLVPELTQSNAFFFFEFLFLLAACAGVFLCLHRRFAARRLLIFALGYCTLTLAAWFYRARGQDFSGFHYLFPLLLLLAPAAAVSADALVPGLGEPSLSRLQRALLLALVVVIVHHGALFGAFNSSGQDVIAYYKTGGALASPVLERLRPGERLAVVGKPAITLHGVPGDTFGRPGCHSALVTELQDLIREAKPTIDPEARQRLSALGVVYVLDLSRNDPRGETLEEWFSRQRSERGLPPEAPKAAHP